MSKLLQRRLNYVDYLWKHVSSILTIPAPLPLVTLREKPQIVNYKKSIVKNRCQTMKLVTVQSKRSTKEVFQSYNWKYFTTNDVQRRCLSADIGDFFFINWNFSSNEKLFLLSLFFPDLLIAVRDLLKHLFMQVTLWISVLR